MSGLIAAHGGALVKRTGERPAGVDQLETITLSAREVADLDMIASGALSPLRGFMGKADYERTVEEMKLAVMGCVVNGPGESKHANIGISLPGTFEEPKAPVYVDGRLFTTLKGDRIVAEFIGILDEYVDSHYAAREVPQEEVAARN